MSQKNYTPIDNVIKDNKKPVSSFFGFKHKESEPFPSSHKKYEIKEVVEHGVEKEVQPFVQPRTETVEIPPDLKNVGVQSTSSTQFPSYQNIKLPISDDKIVAGLHKPVTSSIRWLATLALYILQMAHLTLKVVHGKIIRVVKN